MNVEPVDLDDARTNRIVERPEDYLSDDEMTFLADEAAHEQTERTSEQIVAQVRAFHVEWGAMDITELDQLQLWEQLGRILRGGAA